MGKTKVSLKLLVDTKANKVLFAEASKDFVDFLFHILSLPIGTAIELVSTKGMVGCLGEVYKSVGNLNSDYLQPDFNVDSLLKSSYTASNVCNFLLLKDTPPANSATPKKFYGCSSGFDRSLCYPYVSDSPTASCPRCRRNMSTEKIFVASTVSSSSHQKKKKRKTVSSSSQNVTASGESGYVKGVVTYMIMGNLEVKPMSTISAITMINKFNVKDVSFLAEKQVQFGLDQGIALLKASFKTRAVLTAVFLSKKV